MNISNKTILITGGGSGIGLETVKLLSAKGNKILIVGRNGDKLKKAAEGLKNVNTFAGDITQADSVKKLVDTIKADYSDLSVLINNAGAAHVYNVSEAVNAYDKAKEEFETNYFAPIRLNESLIPILKNQKEALIVHVTSVVAIVPATSIPTYSGSKAAFHSYSQLLRHELAKTSAIKVLELMPPLVNTDFAKEIGGEEHGIPAIDVANALIHGIEQDEKEVHVGPAKDLIGLHFAEPAKAFGMLNPA